MRNLEGIKNVEIAEENVEKISTTVDEGNILNFDDCAKTNEDRIKELMAMREALSFEDCTNEEQSSQIEDDFEDCRKR